MYYGRNSADSFLGFSAVILGLSLYVFFRTKAGQITLWTIVILGVVFLIAKFFLLDLYYEKYSIKSVPKYFVVNNTTIRNRMCTVIFTPKQNIVVMDNDYQANNSKRMFTIRKTDVKISRLWDKICKFFDTDSNLDSLAAFCTIDTNVNIVTFATKQVEVQSLNSNSDQLLQNVEAKSEVKEEVAEENIVTEPVIPESVEVPKIDINKASSEEIASLPGINIVAAKKVIEYRNTKGLFKTKEDFIKVAGVKDYFVSKIASRIEINELEEFSACVEEVDDSRIVDL